MARLYAARPRVATAVLVLGWITTVLAVLVLLAGIIMTAWGALAGGYSLMVLVVSIPFMFLGTVGLTIGLLEVFGAGGSARCCSCNCDPKCRGAMLGIARGDALRRGAHDAGHL